MGKGVFCILLLSACGMVAQAQSPTKNYFLGRQMLDANGSQAITTITYYDDLGYEDEVATTGLNGQGSYVYTKREYNIPGQVTKEWIPGARSVYGEYLDASSLAASSCSFFMDGYPFVTNEYDALGRVHYATRCELGQRPSCRSQALCHQCRLSIRPRLPQYIGIGSL